MSEHMYSAEEAAQILGLQVRTVRNYVRDGRLRGVRIGKQYRIARVDLEAFTVGAVGRAESPDAAGGVTPLPSPMPPAEVSSVVQIDRIGPEARDRLERTLAAAGLAAGGDASEPLRVEPLYDEHRERLKVIIVGSPAETADLLRIIDAFTAERG